MDRISIASLIDYTNLKASATARDIARLCEEAAESRFKTVCVNGSWVRDAATILKGTSVGVCAVVGFPLGAMSSTIKARETAVAIEEGATEIDMVIAIGRLLNHDMRLVEEDIAAVVSAANGQIVKVIIECALINDEQKILASNLCVKAGAQFVKTSTGFATKADGSAGGATVEDVRLLRKTVGPNFGVKASGGIRTLEQAVALIEAGASRIGTSAVF